uniref:DUF834 domain-containing protein n=1 Tax=Oryza brachyantha TaxID=4533 RepID=J3MSR4_ORYBR
MDPSVTEDGHPREGARHRPPSTSPVITGAAIDVDERGGGGGSTVIELLQPQRLDGGEQVRGEEKGKSKRGCAGGRRRASLISKW